VLSASTLLVHLGRIAVLAFLPPLIPPGRRGADLVVRVQQAATRYELGQFAAVPHRLYRGDARWIPPFKGARRAAIRPGRNPLLRDAELGAFLGVAQNLGLGDEYVATLAAWTTGSEATEEADMWGAWGYFETINVEDLPDRLFYEAENWLFEGSAGLGGLRGPLSVEPLMPPGLLTDGYDVHPAAFVPGNPPYYPEMIEGQGYKPAHTWRVYSLDLTSRPAASERTATMAPPTADAWRGLARAYARHRTPAAPAALIPGLVEWLEHLGGGAAFSFDPYWVRAVGRAFRRGLVWIPEGDSAGPAACFAAPDIGDGLRLSRGRQAPLGWLLLELGLRRTRRLRVFPAVAPEEWKVARLGELYGAVAQGAASRGYRQMDIAPVSDSDERSGAALLALGARPAQQFTLYEKVF
jgi:hypothetical protein